MSTAKTMKTSRGLVGAAALLVGGMLSLTACGGGGDDGMYFLEESEDGETNLVGYVEIEDDTVKVGDVTCQDGKPDFDSEPDGTGEFVDGGPEVNWDTSDADDARVEVDGDKVTVDGWGTFEKVDDEESCDG